MTNSKKGNNKKTSKEEVDLAINKIFDSMNEALSEENKHKITLDKVDETLNVLFDAINRAQTEGGSTDIPDFKKILTED